MTISTIVRTHYPEEELKPALDLIGPILEKFITVSDCTKPSEDIKGSNLWITKSYGSSVNIELEIYEILKIYEEVVKEYEKNKKEK